MKKFLFIATIISSLFFVSCDKGKNHIYGKITDMSDGTSVAGVCVDLYLTKVTNNGFSNHFEKFASTTTDEDGNYSLEFAPVNASEYSLRLSKDGYHENYHNFMPSETCDDYQKDLPIPKAGYLHFKIRNAYGAHIGDENDAARIIVNGVNPLCSECCSSSSYIFEGLDVNEDFICNIVAGDQISISRYLTRKGNTQSNNVKNFTCEQNDTIEYIWNY